ncbi:hypothetical protein OAJ14_04355 [Polaribacter sp.]|nr:hypothetical protein [Polaribacter sp.]
MKKLLLILGLFLCKFTYAHDVNMTVFTLSKYEDKYKLEIKFIKHDIEKELINPNTSAISNYINQHTSWFINNKELCFSDFEIVESIHLIKVICYSNSINIQGEIKNIELKNECLLKRFPNQYNIIKLLLAKKKRVFRMDAKKKELSIKY